MMIFHKLSIFRRATPLRHCCKSPSIRRNTGGRPARCIEKYERTGTGTHPQSIYRKHRRRCVQLCEGRTQYKAFAYCDSSLLCIHVLLNNPRCSGSRATAARVSLTTIETFTVFLLRIHDQHANNDMLTETWHATDVLTAKYDSVRLMLWRRNAMSAAVSPDMPVTIRGYH